MKNITLVKKQNLKLICPLCNSKTHDWKDAYFDSGTILKKTEKQYIQFKILMTPNIESFFQKKKFCGGRKKGRKKGKKIV